MLNIDFQGELITLGELRAELKMAQENMASKQTDHNWFVHEDFEIVQEAIRNYSAQCIAVTNLFIQAAIADDLIPKSQAEAWGIVDSEET